MPVIWRNRPMVQGLRAGVRIFGRREARKYPPTKQEGAQLMGVGGGVQLGAKGAIRGEGAGKMAPKLISCRRI